MMFCGIGTCGTGSHPRYLSDVEPTWEPNMEENTELMRRYNEKHNATFGNDTVKLKPKAKGQKELPKKIPIYNPKSGTDEAKKPLVSKDGRLGQEQASNIKMEDSVSAAASEGRKAKMSIADGNVASAPCPADAPSNTTEAECPKKIDKKSSFKSIPTNPKVVTVVGSDKQEAKGKVSKDEKGSSKDKVSKKQRRKYERKSVKRKGIPKMERSKSASILRGDRRNISNLPPIPNPADGLRKKLPKHKRSVSCHDGGMQSAMKKKAIGGDSKTSKKIRRSDSWTLVSEDPAGWISVPKTKSETDKRNILKAKRFERAPTQSTSTIFERNVEKTNTNKSKKPQMIGKSKTELNDGLLPKPIEEGEDCPLMSGNLNQDPPAR